MITHIIFLFLRFVVFFYYTLQKLHTPNNIQKLNYEINFKELKYFQSF
jgi:hypothetical protein